VQRGAVFSRRVSKRANFFGRMGLSHKHKTDTAWTGILAPYKPAYIFIDGNTPEYFCEYFYSQLYSNPEVAGGFQ
jgi:hypothetical protein